MTQEDYYKISEVAKLTGISRQTLIYYDRENILKPAFVDDNKYRYYSVYQINQIQIISMLKEFGTPLKTIKSYLTDRDQVNFENLLDHIKQELNNKIRTMENYVNIIDDRKSLINRSKSIGDYTEIHLEEKKSRTALFSAPLGSAGNPGQGHLNKSYDMEKKLKELGLVGLSLNVMVEQKLLTKDYANEISYFYVYLDEKRQDLELKTIPEGLYATAYHKGRNQTSEISYHRLIDYIHSTGLVIDGNAYETILINHITEEINDEFLSEISIKVRRKSQ